MSVPRATVRLQLHAGFTLDHAREQIPYYASLGVSHLYLSPISCAVPGSLHGYDVIDPTRVNPELGGEPALRALSEALRARGMGILLDIVPNHMATHPGNAWWWDVLARGRQSRYAHWFDIDWRPADKTLYGKVLAPFLAQDYAGSLAGGELRLVHDGERDRYLIEASGGRFPVADGTLACRGRDCTEILAEHDPAEHRGRWRLHELLKRQHYRLCGWRCAADSINWRRFFEISGLAGLRIEEPEVFDAVHELPLKLYEQGLIDGLRIDHVDGLARPLAYCRRLREAMRARRPGGAGAGAEPWVVVEKILAGGEVLDERWQVDGTTGYDFMDQAAAVLHDAHGGARLIGLWQQVCGRSDTAADFLREARTTMLRRHFFAERNALVRRVHELIHMRARPGEWSQEAVDRVLEVFLACFPVYRSYVEGAEAADQDRAVIDRAAAQARARLDPDSGEHRLLDLVTAWLIAIPPGTRPARRPGGPPCDEAACRQEAVRRFEQLTPPLAAKSLEDTVFYRYGPLLSRNEVGSDPSVLAESVDAFHARNAWRAEHYPASLLATASHDHKRGEDARARLAVLSERVEEWERACREWAAWKTQECETPSQSAERYMLWQAMVGAWPLDLHPRDPEALAAFGRRIVQWQRKALREAKQNSSWFDPDLDYELRCAQYVHELLGWAPAQARRLAEAVDADERPDASDGHAPEAGLLCSFHDFVQDIAPAGAVNSLAQTVLRLTSPGVPDLYQGTEWWDFSLVDPDNRRAVDYPGRRRALDAAAANADMAALLAHWRDGRIKQAIIRAVLALRAQAEAVFARGACLPLETAGRRREHVIAYARRLGGQDVIVAVPRLCAQALAEQEGDGGPRIDMTYWDDTGIMVSALGGRDMKDIFTGKTHRPSANAELPAQRLFAELPCAVLVTT